MDIKIKKLFYNSVTPTKGSNGAAGHDLYARSESGAITIMPGETVKVGTGIALEIPHDYTGLVFARSGLATKRGLRPANCTGVIDEDFRGEVIVALYNDSKEPEHIFHGDRIAQLLIMPVLDFQLKVVDEIGNTERGECGFGSTGM